MLKKCIIGSLLYLTLSANALASGGQPAVDEYTQTQHPVVLVHGLWGFDSVLGVDYWYGIESELEDGGATVHVANVPSGNSDEVRGEALIGYLEQLQATHGYERFNLLGHSQGGLTSRYVAGTRPELVASVTTMATPHFGGPSSGESAEMPEFLNTLLSAVYSAIDLVSGIEPQGDAAAAFASLSQEGTAILNDTFPAGRPDDFCGQGQALEQGIYFYSMSGTAQVTNIFDPMDLLIGLTSLGLGDEVEHDGQVERCSSHWGEVIKDDYALNHFDQVNHFIGLKGIGAPEPAAIYRTQLNRLKGLGL